MAFAWRYYFYGPYTEQVQHELDDLVSARLVRPWQPSRSPGFDQTRLYYPIGGQPNVALPPRVTGLADEIASEWGRQELNTLLDFVYFRTPPMQEAVRGEPLDLLFGLDKEWPPFYSPLLPPRVSPAVTGRLDEWRRNHRALLERPDIGPPARYDESYANLIRETGDREADMPAIRGRLGVAEDFDPEAGR
jgi:hypothetical protein